MSTALEKLTELASANPESLKAVAQIAGFEDIPPTIDQFIEDPYFLGDVLAKEDVPGGSVYPFWRNALRKIYPSPFYSPYVEVVLTGSIGQGKSTCASIGLCYDICRLLYLKSPQSYYSLMSSTKIVFSLINATLDLAGGVLFDQIQSWFTESPYFKVQIAKAQNRGTMFPKNIDIQVGSRQTHTLGKAIVSSIMSEVNFQSAVFNQAYNNYNSIRTRLQSRFMTRNGYPGRVWIDSSKNETGSFIEDIILKDRGSDPELIVFDNPIWNIFAHTDRYLGVRLENNKIIMDPKFCFQVFVGNDVKDPFIVTDTTLLSFVDPERVIYVPNEHRDRFNRDLPQALRDLAGVSTQLAFKFIMSVEKIIDALQRKNPVTRDIIYLDFYDKDDKLIDYIDWTGILKSQKARYVHIDLGIVNDKCGIAFSFVDEIIKTVEKDAVTFKDVHKRKPIFATDLVLSISSKPGQEVPIYKIHELFIDMRSRGYPIAQISTDGYQSTELRQNLKVDGFTTKLVSVDRGNDPYNTLKRAIIESRWKSVKHPVLETEIKELESSRGKIDHPINGSKDLSDACAGSLYEAYMALGDAYGEDNTNHVLANLERLTAPKSTYEQIANLANKGSSSYFNFGRG